jgi:hypothetical protein
MKKKLVRLTAAFMLAVSSYGIFITQTTNAQCGCSCAVVCPNTCNFECSGCGLTDWIPVAAACCQAQWKDTKCSAD